MSSHNLKNKIYLDHLSYCYPCKTRQLVKPENMGVLKQYYKKPLSKEEADKIIYRFFKRNPYIENSMELHVTFHERTVRNGQGLKMLYFSHDFPNYNYQKQKEEATPKIRYNF